MLKRGGVFFSFLRKQPTPNPMFAQPKGTSPLARQRRNAQMLCKSKRQAQLCPPSHSNTNLSEAPTQPVCAAGPSSHSDCAESSICYTHSSGPRWLLIRHRNLWKPQTHSPNKHRHSCSYGRTFTTPLTTPSLKTWHRAHPTKQFGVRAAAHITQGLVSGGVGQKRVSLALP